MSLIMWVLGVCWYWLYLMELIWGDAECVSRRKFDKGGRLSMWGFRETVAIGSCYCLLVVIMVLASCFIQRLLGSWSSITIELLPKHHLSREEFFQCNLIDTENGLKNILPSIKRSLIIRCINSWHTPFLRYLISLQALYPYICPSKAVGVIGI